jgi:hypothetical protein
MERTDCQKRMDHTEQIHAVLTHSYVIVIATFLISIYGLLSTRLPHIVCELVRVIGTFLISTFQAVWSTYFPTFADFGCAPSPDSQGTLYIDNACIYLNSCTGLVHDI